MQELEKILEKMKEIKDGNRKEKLYAKYPPHREDQKVLNAYSQGYEDGTDNFYNAVVEIIRKHMNDGWIPVDKNNVPDHEILACDRYKNELIGYLSYNADLEEFVCESDECIMYQVIAWMEKPEPYRPERSEEE